MVIHFLRFFFRLAGWKMNPAIPPEAYKKCVMIAAPHTALSDATLTLGAFGEMGIPLRYAIKKEFNFFPVGAFLASAGALWIDRSGNSKDRGKKSYVEQMTDLFADRESLVMLIAAEGTRTLRTEWKTGFYYVASNAGVPITLGYLNYKTKEAGVGPAIYPSGDMEADMRKIMDFYRNIPGKYPEKFALDERYA